VNPNPFYREFAVDAMQPVNAEEAAERKDLY
jgi:hypothetical protein